MRGMPRMRNVLAFQMCRGKQDNSTLLNGLLLDDCIPRQDQADKRDDSMDYNHQAESVFQLLTHKNPEIKCLPMAQSCTRNSKYHYPQQIKKWIGFDFSMLERYKRGALLCAARRKQDTPLPPYPPMCSRIDCVIHDEKDTIRVFTKWNEDVRGEKPKARARGSPKRPKKSRAQPKRQCSTKPIAQSSKTGKETHFRPDSGAVSQNSFLPKTDAHYEPPLERFPKEYKVEGNWSSKELFDADCVDENGMRIQASYTKDIAMPLRQAYTYCVVNFCRYGCILTTKELFVFRVTPRREQPALQDGLIQNGLMEWASIPWSNHCESDFDNYRSWTVNLGMWFLHVLVGSDYRVDWRYDAIDGHPSNASNPAVSGDEEREAQELHEKESET
ncbi:hypothetical protein HJFPF1_10126 [Paramyrothecium foliicola]|nr:hypothetical protein HJFPF1_10126 [Paramyrothecium foliicola]